MRFALHSLLLLATACGAEPDTHRRVATAVARATDGNPVAAGHSLQAAIDAAPTGAVLLLAPGDHVGAVRIDKPLTIWGPPDAILRGAEGTTIRVASDDVTLRGFTVAGSGQRFDLMDGGIHLTGNNLTVEGVTVRDALFGILAERCTHVLLRGNRIIGTGIAAMGLRGDGIRLWETTDSEVADNVVSDSRDVVVWYSSRNQLRGNTVTTSRYGTHFMYSNDCVVEDGRYLADEVGVFIMYSRDIVMRRTLIAEARGAAGIGIGLKESGNLCIEDCWFLANTTGIYSDNSPLDPAHENHYSHNVLRFSETAVSFHSSPSRNRFRDNRFADNAALVKVGGQGDAMSCVFTDNYYDTYQGFDFDGDGRGDVPFEFRRLSIELEARFPQLALLHGAPAMGMVDLVGEVMPLFQPRQLMVDATPRMRALAPRWVPEDSHAR